ncbi:sulfotransferase family protein [Marinigracilibium pacificum]|uniref:Sulfotransferase n=1 Tax=Marinigracilibium pacificum TaxID=2729599 RepID=A0A848J535_9BACT|nr:sulfotransferase [Marinigracilibium pacificum]NMM49459.1 sulfotransferase [Marinigracilibium pacificum]
MPGFELPPISPLAGANVFNFLKIIRKGKIQNRYFIKVLLTFLVTILALPFHIWEKIWYHRKIKRFEFTSPPIFIIGHWRSGTTLLHNLMTCDPKSSYFTTYNGVFPNNLASKLIFKTFMRVSMPGKRPSDNVKLGPDLPQEDEFAVGNWGMESFYLFFFFPYLYEEVYTNAVHIKQDSKKQKWLNDYDELLKKACINTGKGRLIVKNPVNTARLKLLTEYYHDSAFIFIHRNPYHVYLSTKKFFGKLFPSIMLHGISPEEVEDLIFDLYKKLLSDYYNQKETVSSDRLLEIRFEDLETGPEKVLKDIYLKFEIGSYQQAEMEFKNYLKVNSDYKKNNYTISIREFNRINAEWAHFISKTGYSFPDDIKIID